MIWIRRSSPAVSAGVDYAPTDNIIVGLAWSYSQLEPGTQRSETTTCYDAPPLFRDPTNPLAPSTIHVCHHDRGGPAFKFANTDASVLQIQLKLKFGR